MKLIEQSHNTLHIDDLKRIEIAGRTCYKSEDKITADSADKFVRMLIKRGHSAMLEHGSASVHFTTNRGVTHELVRHRIASFGQESTRYVNYKNGVEFIRPVWWEQLTPEAQSRLLNSFREDELEYIWHIENGYQPQEAREILPNALKTEIVVTANLREWRHIFKLRAVGTTGKPHPQMQALMLPVLKEFYEACPAMFEDIYTEAVEKGLYDESSD